MPEKLNTEGGKIPGRIQPQNNPEGRIGGKNPAGANSDGRISGNRNTMPPADEAKSDPINAERHEKNPLTKKERIAKATTEKGLKELPSNFENTDGDWLIIDSDDLFELLYLDHEQIELISPEIVKGNFEVLEKFWKAKYKLADSGSTQNSDSVKEKYGAGRIANSAKKLQYALQQLFTLEKIKEYHALLSYQRIQKGALKLEPLLKMMVKDGEADTSEIEGIIEEGLQNNLNREEVAGIIKNVIDMRAYKPYGRASGTLLSEQLLSVSWMSDEKMKVRLEEDKAKKNQGREIFDNIFAYSVEEIGEIIFNNEKEAKIYIANGLLKNSIDYFSPAKANQFVTIINTQKNEHLRYLQAAYRLKPQLPYRFNSSTFIKSPKELVDSILETPENFQSGREQFKNAYPEVWLLETNKEAYQKIEKIRTSAENTDSAFTEFLYTFNPLLPYRFNSVYLVKTPEDLSFEINNSRPNWEAGKKELFNGQIPIWLQTAKQSPLYGQWNKVKKEFAKAQDLGLEYFLHLLNDKLDSPKLSVNYSAISLPEIQSGKIVKLQIIFHNETRGHLEAKLKLSKVIGGVSLSASSFKLNNLLGLPSFITELTIDSSVLLKGLAYQTSITIVTSAQQKLEIPLTFRIVFPRNAFILEIAKFAAIGAAFFMLVRLALSYQFPSLVSSFFPSFVDWNAAIHNLSDLQLFGWTFVLFFTGMSLGIYYLTKYLLSK